MFFCQVVATVIAGTVQLGVQVRIVSTHSDHHTHALLLQSWMFTNIPDMCTPDQPSGFSCPGTTVFGTASIIWGVIGPQRVFSSGQIYNKLLWFFLLGAGLPIATYFLQKRFRSGVLKYVNWPVIFTGTGLIPPATPTNYVSWCVVGFIFNYVIRRRHFSWWTKYNCKHSLSHYLVLRMRTSLTFSR